MVAAKDSKPSGMPAEPRPPAGVSAPLITELVWFNYAWLPPRNVLSPHLHAFHQLDVVLEGTVRHEIEGAAPRLLSPGDAAVICPLMRHGSYSHDGYRHASLKVFLAPSLARALGDAVHFFRPSGSVVEDLERAGRDLEQGRPFAIDRALAAGSLVLIEAAEDGPESAGRPEEQRDFRSLVLPVLQEVDEAPSETWSVARMAERCRLSVDYFSKCFQKTLGQSPQQYLIESRMRSAAAQLLRDPPVAIKQVASALGYSSVQTFSRAFRTAVGVSPGAFRRGARPAGGPSPYRVTLLD